MCSIPVRCTLKFRLPGFWPSPVAMNVCRWTSAVISMSHASKSLCWAGTCTDNQPPSMYLKALILFLLWYCNRLQAHTRTQAHQPPKRQWKGGGEGEGTRTVSQQQTREETRGKTTKANNRQGEHATRRQWGKGRAQQPNPGTQKSNSAEQNKQKTSKDEQRDNERERGVPSYASCILGPTGGTWEQAEADER